MFGKDMSKMANSLKERGGLVATKVKGNAMNAGLKLKIQQREQQFGVEYFRLIKSNASHTELQQCLDTAKADVDALEAQREGEKGKMARSEAKHNKSPTPAVAVAVSSPKPPKATPAKMATVVPSSPTKKQSR